MRFLRGFIALFIWSCGFHAVAQTKEQEKQPRILILLDGSSSMGNQWGSSDSRFRAASRIILSLMDSLYKVNKDVEFALRVYGHQSPSQYNNCYDTKLEVMFSKDNYTQMSLRLASLHAIGVSPIAFSLKEAAEFDLVSPDRNTYSLILITDGEESCGGDICAIVRQLLDKRIDFKPYILSLVDNTALKSQYDCLGNYLVVAGEKDIKPTVGKIVDAYRPMLTLTTLQRKIIESTPIKAPSAMNVSIPKFEVKKEVEVTEPVSLPKTPAPAPKPKIETPPAKQPEVKLSSPAINTSMQTKQLSDELPRVDVPKPPPVVAKPDIAAPASGSPAVKLTNPGINTTTPDVALNLPVVEMAPLKARATTRTFPIYYATPVFSTRKSPVYTPPVIEREPVVAAAPPPPPPPPPAPKPAPKPVVKKPVEAIPPVELTKPKELKYTQKSEESKETTLQVYFTDGKGTFYQTTPQLVLLEPKTKQPVQKFYRTINAAGAPDPQKVPAGTYSLTITGKANYIVPDIRVEANKNTAIMIPVTEGSIYFGYDNNPNRAVEYIATVYHRFSSSPVVKQKCTQELYYEPGTYHVEINTLPPHKRTFDLNFGEQYLVEIPEEGDLVITNTNNVGKVTLYYPFGDQFRIFHTLNVEGSAEGVKLRLLPGTYKAGFRNGTNADQTVVQFVIRSNNVTNLELK